MVMSQQKLNLKPDYRINNFCSGCKIVYPKTEFQCAECHRYLRTKPRRGLRNRKYQELKPRIE